MPSVTYESSYKRRDKPWEKGLFAYPIVGWKRLCRCEWLWAIVEFGEVEDFREGILSQGVLTSISEHISFIVQPHCSLGVRGEGEYPRSRLGGQPVGHYIRIKHGNIQAWR